MFDEDDPRRTVHLLRLQGWPNDRIAERMGTTNEMVDRWASEAETISRTYMAEKRERLLGGTELPRVPPYTPEQRRADAQTLLDSRTGWGPILSVAESGEDGWTFNVRFNDLAATTFSDLVVSTVAFLREASGVIQVLHADRELIAVAAPTLSRLELEEQLQTWWTERLREAART